MNDNPNQNYNDNNDYIIQLKPKVPPVRAAFIGLAGGFFFYQIVGGMLTLLIFGLDIENANVNSMRLMTIAGQILFILLPALIFSKIIYEDVTSVLRFHRFDIKLAGLFIIGMVILTPLLQNIVLIQNYFFEKLAEGNVFFNAIKSFMDSLNDMVEKTYGNLLSVNNIIDGVLVITAVSVVPAVCEEVLFRGFIQKSFELRFRLFFGAIITAFFFALYHFNPYALIPLFVLGWYLGYSLYVSDSIFVSILLHFVNNFSAIVLYLILGESELTQNQSVTPEELPSAVLTVVYLSVAFAVLIISIKVYLKKKKKLEVVNSEGRDNDLQ